MVRPDNFRGWHVDCAQLSQIDPNFLCGECITGVDHKGYNISNSKFKLVKEWHIEISRQKSVFLREMKDCLIPFCGENSIDSIIARLDKSTARKGNHKTTFEPVPIRNTPPYLTNITLRNYQLEGISTMIYWFRRGIGGILAGNTTI